MYISKFLNIINIYSLHRCIIPNDGIDGLFNIFGEKLFENDIWFCDISNDNALQYGCITTAAKFLATCFITGGVIGCLEGKFVGISIGLKVDVVEIVGSWVGCIVILLLYDNDEVVDASIDIIVFVLLIDPTIIIIIRNKTIIIKLINEHVSFCLIFCSTSVAIITSLCV